MVYVLLFYGLAFLILATVVLLQREGAERIISKRALSCLGLFALTHGICEWLSLVKAIEARGAGLTQGLSQIVDTAESAFLVLSFVFLLLFSRALLQSVRQGGVWDRFLPHMGVALWLVSFMGASWPLGVEDLFLNNLFSRYFLAVPGGVATGVGLFKLADSVALVGRTRLRIWLKVSAGTFLAYAVFAGLIGPRADFFPASVINADSFRAAFGFPVQVLRMVCALFIAVSLSVVFTYELTRLRNSYERLREGFITVVAHDLRSTLSGIVCAVELLQKRAGQEREAKDTRLMDVTLHGAQRLNRLISDLSDSSLIESRQLTLQKSRIDLKKLLSSVIDAEGVLVPEREFRIVLPDDPVWANVDEGRVEQIVRNLLSNAEKYSPPQTPIDVRLTKDSKEAVVSVANQGEALSREQLERVFDRFYRVRTQEKAPGTGLGLYIVKGLVEAHGGAVRADSIAGQVVFEFRLPLAGI